MRKVLVGGTIAVVIVMVIIAAGSIRKEAPAEIDIVGTDSGDHTFEIGDRKYFVHVPDSYSGEPTPLVLNLHGGGGDIEAARKQTRMEGHADENGYIVAFPEGSGRDIGSKHIGSWNAGRCCGTAEKRNVDDVRFIGEVIDDIESRLSIDPSRVYATGHSNGALMSYRLACDMSERIAAIAPNAGHDSYDDCEPARKVPVFHMHGTEDNSALYEGGHCGGDLGDDGWDCVSVQEYAGEWAAQNGCDLSTEVVYQKGAATCEAYAGCEADVVLCTIEGTGHTWPGGEYAVDLEFWKKAVGEISGDLDANDRMWEFFKKHSI